MTTNEEMLTREQLRVLQTRMLRHAIDHMPEQIDRRTALIFTKNELLNAPLDFSFPEACLEAVERPESPVRCQSTRGPLLVLSLEKTTRTSIDLVTFLLSPDVRFRQGALRELDRQMKLYDPFISPSTRNKAETLRPAITQQEASGLSAAVELSDALKGDYFYNLAGCGQSARLELEDQLREFLRKVLIPTEAMVHFLLDLPIWSPLRQRAELTARLSQAAVGQSLSEFLDKYFRYFGHLPLGGEFSAANAFTTWLEQHPWHVSYPAKVWSWARKNGSPLATYHACQLLLGHQARLSGSEKRVLVRQVAAMQSNHGFVSWQQRCTLAAHYCRHLELVAPGADGERVAAMSWWLSERLACLGDGFSKRAMVVYESEIKTASASSHELWRTCRPPVSGSSLRYATLYLPSIWASSALCELANSKLDSLLGQMSKERELIAQSLAPPVARLDGLEPSASGKAYAFEYPLGEFHAAVVQMASRRKTRKTRTNRSNNSMPDRSIEDQVRWLHTAGDKEAVVLALRAASYSGNVAPTPIWEAFSDPNWRRAVLVQGSPRAVELMTEAALELVARDEDHDWRSYLPHFLAIAADDESNSPEGRKILFDMIVLVSISVDSVSAIERLLRGVGRNRHEEVAKEWREKIERLTPHAPSWVASRMRGIKCVLYVT
ncbi:hypothetical protein [Lignipirellula cremea]|uniref:Uncharacterized protein n=1 Tax=Lignipirellula cremea TaxID=2528010 RepID=A0A518DRL5_9BACT|nr:hypothetical protein [Lignipirellula cremea]QDU94485.1 hypothetical protein Pla8534_22760 [Lignipirellula cremea]